MVDALVEKVIQAETREQLEVAGPRARPGAARQANLGAELVQRQVPRRLLGRVRPPRDPAALRARRRLLVVRPGEVRQAEGRGRAALTGSMIRKSVKRFSGSIMRIMIIRAELP